MTDEAVHPWLLPLLAAAVHRDLDEVRAMTAEQRKHEAARVVDTVAGHGDRLLRWEPPGSRRHGRRDFREAWTGTVRGLALAAMAPGGVTFCGLRFDAEEMAAEPLEPVQQLTPDDLQAIVRHLVDVWDLSLRPPAGAA